MANCKSKGETGVKGFSDCNQVSNYTNDQVCCFIYGTNADGSSYRGCVAMNMTMFGNKTFSYDSETISGTLICDINYNFSNYPMLSKFDFIKLSIIKSFKKGKSGYYCIIKII